MIILNKYDSYGNPIEVRPKEIELVEEQTEDKHQDDVREHTAIIAMHGVMNFFSSLDYNKETIAKLAVEQADALIEELKKK